MSAQAPSLENGMGKLQGQHKMLLDSKADLATTIVGDVKSTNGRPATSLKESKDGDPDPEESDEEPEIEGTTAVPGGSGGT